MKVIRNNMCFVGVDDLKRCPISKSPEWFNNSKFAGFSEKEEIEYFKYRSDIIDDDVVNLSDEELMSAIIEIQNNLRKSIFNWLNKSDREDGSLEYMKSKEYTAIYDCLTNYKVNRDIVDNEIKELEKSIDGNKSLLKTLEK